MAEWKILKFKFYSNNITYFLSNLIGTDCKVELIFVSQSFLIFAILNNLIYLFPQSAQISADFDNSIDSSIACMYYKLGLTYCFTRN